MLKFTKIRKVIIEHARCFMLKFEFVKIKLDKREFVKTFKYFHNFF